MLSFPSPVNWSGWALIVNHNGISQCLASGNYAQFQYSWYGRGSSIIFDLYYATSPTLDMLYTLLYFLLISTPEHYNFHVSSVLPSWIWGANTSDRRSWVTFLPLGCYIYILTDFQESLEVSCRRKITFELEWTWQGEGLPRTQASGRDSGDPSEYHSSRRKQHEEADSALETALMLILGLAGMWAHNTGSTYEPLEIKGLYLKTGALVDTV